MYIEKNLMQRGRAKINLLLDVGPVRPDGYHETNMIMQSLKLCDKVRLQICSEPEHHVGCNIPFLNDMQKNIAYKALMLMTEQYQLKEKVAVWITKQIPIAAGLAGGSTDAAAVIRGMNHLFHLHLRPWEMRDLGAKLGSDVPFCISGGTALATGRGEQIASAFPFPKTYVLLVKPRFSISTPWAYQQFDLIDHPPRLNCDEMIQAIRTGDPSQVASAMCNTLELPAMAQYPVLKQIKADLLGVGAFASMMSGSGPTMYGLFLTEDAAFSACQQLKTRPEYADMTLILTETENPDTDEPGPWKIR